ncbi:MAG: hypothetical protein V7641_2882 [Blastocatellia bacterium]
MQIRRQKKYPLAVPIPCDLIDKRVPGSNLDHLRGFGVAISGYWHLPGRKGECRTFEIEAAQFAEHEVVLASAESDLSFEEYRQQKLVNFMDCRTVRGRQRSSKQTETGNSGPFDWCQAVDSLSKQPKVFDYERVYAWVQALEPKRDIAKREYNEAVERRDDQKLIDKKERDLDDAHGLLVNDRACLGQLRRQNPQPTHDGFYFYYQALEKMGGGRMAEKGGGLMSCSKGMKSAAFHGLPDLKNYDMPDAHLRTQCD